MNKPIENKWLQLALYIIVFIIMDLILFPLFDYIYSLINNNQFVYTAYEYILKPAGFGLVFGIVFWALENGIKSKEDKK